MDSRMILLTVLAFIGLVMLIAGYKKAFKSSGGFKTVFMILGTVLLVYGVVGIGAQAKWYTLPTQAQQFFLSTGVSSVGNGDITCPTGTTLVNGNCVSTNGGNAYFQPTGAYTAKDKYSTTAVTGTSYYKRGSAPATTTTATNLNVGESIIYWVSNSTWWVTPDTDVAGTGVTQFQVLGLTNSTATVTLYDPVNKQPTTNGAYNSSMAANALAYVDITYAGTAQGSAGPFGGVMVFERNSTISSVSCTSPVLMDSNPFHLTYTVSSISDSYDTFAYSPSLDDGSGNVKVINCQVKNGASAAGAGAFYYVRFYPANWYVTKAGDIVLDTQKFADSDSTKVGSIINRPQAQANFGA